MPKRGKAGIEVPPNITGLAKKGFKRLEPILLLAESCDMDFFSVNSQDFSLFIFLITVFTRIEWGRFFLKSAKATNKKRQCNRDLYMHKKQICLILCSCF